MGAYLSKPITEKESEEGESEQFKYGVAAMQGWRTEMEDAHAMSLDVGDDGKTGFFAVFDGHGGKEVAKFAALKMAKELVRTEGWSRHDLQKALIQVYLRMDELLMRDEARPELEGLAGDTSPTDSGQPLMVDAADLPEALRVQLAALDQARARSDRAKRSSRRGAGPRGTDSTDDEEPVPAELVELDNALTADVAAAVAKAAAESEAASMENSSAEASEQGDSPPASPQTDSGDSPSGRNGKRKRELAAADGAMDVSGDQGQAERPVGLPAQPEAPTVNGVPQEPQASAAAAAPEGNGNDADVDSSSSGSGSSSSSGDDVPRGRPPVPPVSDKWTGPMAGCTAVAALVSEGALTVANAGDSRCVMCRAGRAVAMTVDHKPNDEAEHDRILKAGGFVTDGRVNGSLNLSRALGDMEYKQSADLEAAEQIVTAMPEVRRLMLQDGDEFLLLACDGIWDVLTNQQAVDFVRARLQRGMHPRKICEELCDACLAPNTNGCGRGCDNMSAMVVLLKGTAADLAALQQAPGKQPPVPLPAVPNPEVFDEDGDPEAAAGAEDTTA